MRRDLTLAARFAPLRLCVRLLICLIWLPATSPIRAHEADESAALRKASQYLWSQQAEDGGWHSGQYAVLRSGQALTPFVLHTLLHVPESNCPRPQDGPERALGFIRAHIDKNGALGHADPDIVEYPVYSTAYATMCATDVGDIDLAQQTQGFLLLAQFQVSNGFNPSLVAYGGWGLDAPRKKGESGHMDLAHTRRAIQAIVEERRWNHANYEWRNGKAETQLRLQQFLRVVQRPDGGFYFSPVVLAANKGREEEISGSKYFRSYATATCDGILALLACNVPRDDERLARAAQWLKAHDDIEYPQGVPVDHPEPWGDAIRFYHYAVRAETYDALHWPGDWRAQIRSAVAKRQAADGSFRNTASPLMKEDDPVLCTTLATVALSHCAGSR